MRHKDTPFPGSVERLCHHCGTAFYVFPSKAMAGRGIYCTQACRGAFKTAQTIERFWVRTVKAANGCLIWQGAVGTNGYGYIGRRGKVELTHRVAWEMTNGPIPAGIEVCHNCPGGDNPACLNPAHLFLGTHADNMADMSTKGRASNATLKAKRSAA